MKYCSLQKVIDLISQNSGIHICINDVEGILYSDILKIDSNNKIHSKAFCDIAKSTAKGYNLCISCKTCANRKAVYEKKEFSGYCPYGLYEFVKPVVIDNVAVCVIYVGNIVIDKEKTIKKIKHTARLTGIDADKLINKLEKSVYASDLDNSRDIAVLIDSYIHLLTEKTRRKEEKYEAGCRHKVNELIEYINYHYDKSISLKQAAKLYFVNEKYLGRVFKSETGYTFHHYLNHVRINHAISYLENTDKSILDISLDCGFGNVTYFNRCFMKFYGMTPTQYRRRYAKH